MSQRLSRAEVERIAALASLELSEAEAEMFGRQLAEILAYAQQVQQLDTSGVPPTSHVLVGEALDRADETRPSLDRTRALEGAPDAAPETGLFRVPRVIG